MPYRQKHTWIFSGPQKGWSESLYIENISPDIPTGITLAQTIAEKRAACLGNGLSIKAVRVQQVEDELGAAVTRIGDTNSGTQYPSPASQTAIAPDTSLLLDCVTAGFTLHKKMYMGGIWKVISDNFGTYVPTAGWNTVFNNWASSVIAAGYGWVHRIPTPKVPTDTITSDINAIVTVKCAAGTFAAWPTTPMKANITDLATVGKPSPLNGERLFVKVDDDSIKTLESVATGPIIGTGFVNWWTFSFRQIGVIGPEKIRSRERGAPLLESPGRR